MSVKIAVFCDFLRPIIQPSIAPFSSDMPIYIVLVPFWFLKIQKK